MSTRPQRRVLSSKFYDRPDVVAIARELIGKYLIHVSDEGRCAGRIVETEAYVGITDRASHSFNGRRTVRNEHMYATPGTSYVYICYGIHHMFNIVTNKAGIPDAVLIRALEPLEGTTVMAKRTGKTILDKTICRGPGNLAKAMGFTLQHAGISLNGRAIWLEEDHEESLADDLIGVSGRIGVEGAGAEAASMPYRFYMRGNPHVSGRPVR